MTLRPNSTYDSPEEILQRGRLALDALKSREEAARFHAASLDLQIALMEAQSGNEIFLQEWWKQYRGLIDEVPELKRQFSDISSSLGLAAPVEDIARELMQPCKQGSLATSTTLPSCKQGSLATSTTLPSSVAPSPSPWEAMIEGAKKRASTADKRHAKKDLSVLGQSPTAMEEDTPIVVPASVQAKLQLDREAEPRKWWKVWISPSVLGSTVAHIVVLIVMSTFVIQMARQPEPKAIVASAVDTELVSMEAPMEIPSPESPSLEPIESDSSQLPEFSALAEASNNDVQLATGVGLTSDSPASTSDAIQQATSSKSNANAVNSVQFFGVKAVGNVFCYVVDNSPSMKKDGAFAAAKAELVRSLSLLKPKQRFYIFFFGAEIERLKLDGQTEVNYPVYATADNLQKTLVWIERMRTQPNGASPNKVFIEAIEMDPDGIFLLFDGDTSVDVAASLRKSNRSDDLISGNTPRVPIHTIGFYTQEFENLMKRIAQENMGTYRFVPNPMKSR